jgi:hypothetical protein
VTVILLRKWQESCRWPKDYPDRELFSHFQAKADHLAARKMAETNALSGSGK